MIWAGRYLLGLQSNPAMPTVGWTVGKGTLEKEKTRRADLFLCTRSFATEHAIGLQRLHARFNFSRENRAFCIAGSSRSQLAVLTVNGEAVSQQLFALNQYSMKIRFDKLEYDFRYTDFTSTSHFKTERDDYLTSAIGGPITTGFDMPTPLRSTRTIGQWALLGPLGKGISGKVSLASNSKNEVVAIKVVERNSKSASNVDGEIAVYKEITALAKRWDDDEAVVRLREVLYDKEEKFSSTSAFEDVAMVLEPMTPQTLVDLIGHGSKG